MPSVAAIRIRNAKQVPSNREAVGLLGYFSDGVEWILDRQTDRQNQRDAQRDHRKSTQHNTNKPNKPNKMQFLAHSTTHHLRFCVHPTTTTATTTIQRSTPSCVKVEGYDSNPKTKPKSSQTTNTVNGREHHKTYQKTNKPEEHKDTQGRVDSDQTRRE